MDLRDCADPRQRVTVGHRRIITAIASLLVAIYTAVFSRRNSIALNGPAAAERSRGGRFYDRHLMADPAGAESP